MSAISNTRLSVREQAQREVDLETSQKNITKMKSLLLQRKNAQEILRGIDRQIEDLELQLADGTA